jgi:hypothetical protein
MVCCRYIKGTKGFGVDALNFPARADILFFLSWPQFWLLFSKLLGEIFFQSSGHTAGPFGYSPEVKQGF